MVKVQQLLYDAVIPIMLYETLNVIAIFTECAIISLFSRYLHYSVRVSQPSKIRTYN